MSLCGGDGRQACQIWDLVGGPDQGNHPCQCETLGVTRIGGSSPQLDGSVIWPPRVI
jgi:hypothetical protein